MITIIKKKTEGNHNYNVYNIIIIIVFRHCLMQLEISYCKNSQCASVMLEFVSASSSGGL